MVKKITDAIHDQSGGFLGRIVSMVVFRGKLYVATEIAIFVKEEIDNEDIFVPVKFVVA